MNTVTIVLLVILGILIAAVIALYFLGKKMQKKQEEQEEMIAASAQQMSMLIIDKARMRLKDANLPAVVLEQTPKYLRRSKVPIVKAKVGPRIMTLMCDEKVYELIPVKKEVKATVSGIYITAVRGVRGPLETPKKKKGFFAKLRDKADKELKEVKETPKDTKKNKKG
ncbi:MAG: hypothetical protein HFG41_03010 [Coprococcus sp.]|nr:hypothetical protein [Coprococcus sp.]